MGATRFGPYLLLERVNVGGMAEVFKARPLDPAAPAQLVAIKRILPSIAADEELVRMFRDEAALTSRLRHPNLVRTFGLGEAEGAHYLVMEYIDGRDLRAVLRRLSRRGGRMSPRLAACVVARVCRGLDFAHRQTGDDGRPLHIVHRDVSPQNVIVSHAGEVRVVDFGLARAAERLARTRTGFLKGKVGYMSPEQARAQPVDARSDVFAAGILLHELCTGERLFDGPTSERVLEQVEAARVLPPSRGAPGISPRLDAIALKALAREPADRHQSAAEMGDALDAFLREAGEVGEAELAAFVRDTFAEDAPFDPADTIIAPVPAPARRAPAARAIALAVLSALLAGAALFAARSRVPR